MLSRATSAMTMSLRASLLLLSALACSGASGAGLDAVKKMTVQDAKGILAGGDDAATRYFKKHTEQPLPQKFLPIVKKALDGLYLVMAEEEKAIRKDPVGRAGTYLEKVFGALRR